jgi:6,7-dimethyl-8-ribityllumazine synthase
MSTSDKAPAATSKLRAGEIIRVAIVAAEWNSKITGALTKSALNTLSNAGVKPGDVKVFHVPGAIELTFAASQIIETGLFDAVIVFGCVIRGGTPHFDYVCQSVTQGITHLNAECDIPVIFGVLTVDKEQDAIDRCGGICGDKGAEAADAAIRMHQFKLDVEAM